MRTEAKEFIETHYAEFPETVLHANLCIAFALLDGRSVPKSLRAFAAERLCVVKSDPLRAALRAMSKTMFPEAELARIKACVVKMTAFASREMRRGGYDK